MGEKAAEEGRTSTMLALVSHFEGFGFYLIFIFIFIFNTDGWPLQGLESMRDVILVLF